MNDCEDTQESCDSIGFYDLAWSSICEAEKESGAWTGMEDPWPMEDINFLETRQTCAEDDHVLEDQPLAEFFDFDWQSDWDDAPRIATEHEEDIDLSFPASKYDLRPGSREIQAGLSSTWLDNDDTGDYDPTLKKRRPRVTPRKRQKISYDESISSPREGEAFDSSNGSQEYVAPALLVSIIISNPGVRRQLSEYLSKPTTAEELNVGDSLNSYHFRSRHAAQRLHFDGACSTRALSQNLPDDLTGHPVARGCYECLNIGCRCSLLDNEFEWPCKTCKQDGLDCMMVIPPLRKLPCNNCVQASKRDRWLVCSYIYDQDHLSPCTHCQLINAPCFAGPDPEHVRQRVYIGDNGELWLNQRPEQATIRMPKSCRQCQQARRICSFANGSGDISCIACEMTDAECNPILTTTLDNEEPAQAKLTLSEQLLPSNGAEDMDLQPTTTLNPPEPEMPPDLEPANHTIRTKFCHPIKFNHEHQCHFCSSAQFAILGLEPREVQVVDSKEGGGYEEAHGGHKADGVDSTKLCILCTMQRLQIIMCDIHQLRPLPKRKPEDLGSLEDALSDLISGQYTKTWCSVCCNLASHGCCTTQLTETFGLDSGKNEGCGLCLCNNCASALAERHRGSLHDMLNYVTDVPSETRPLGLRADWELLRQDGLLLKYVIWSQYEASM